MIASLVMIAAYAAVVIFQTQKKDRHGETDISYSWVGARIKSATQSHDIHALMSWKDLSCRYPSRKSGCVDFMTLSLSGTTGEIRCKELLAIMVCDTCNMFQLVSLSVSQMELLPYLYFCQFLTNLFKRRGEPTSFVQRSQRRLALHWTHDSVSMAQSRCNFFIGSLSLILMLTVDGHTCG